MRRNLIVIVIVASIALVIVFFNDPVHSKLHQLARLSAIGGFWAALLMLGWRIRPLRAVLFALPVLIAAAFLLPGKPVLESELRADYISRMRDLSGVPYHWGGESRRGIDCSGLPRKALREALLSEGVRHFNGDSIRLAAAQWWNDSSARAIAAGYRGYARPLGISGTVANLDYERLLPGDLAVTANGIHVMIYLEGDQWIQADPGTGSVVVLNGRKDRNPWFESRVTLHRWSVFSPSL